MITSTLPEPKNVEDIPKRCAFFAKKLSELPLFNLTGRIAEKCKTLPLDNWDDCRICDILSSNARKILDQKNWHIHSFGCGYDQRKDVEGNWIKHGLELWLYDHLEMCPFEDLEPAYKKLISQLQSNWKSSSLKQHSNIFFKEDETEWLLFVKKNPLHEEDTLVRFLTSKLGMGLEKKIRCYNDWLTKENALKHSNKKIYMWIRKDAFDEINALFGFFKENKDPE